MDECFVEKTKRANLNFHCWSAQKLICLSQVFGRSLWKHHENITRKKSQINYNRTEQKGG